MWIITEIEALLAKLKAEAEMYIALVLSFFKEAISEEEAALFPAFKTQVIAIFNDEAKMAGLGSVQAMVNVAVADATADLAADIVLAKNALFNSWAWAIAHQQGITGGNQGNLPGGTQTTG